MVSDWIELCIETIQAFVYLLFDWKLLGVPVAAYIICTSIIIILVKGFLYKIQG